MSSNRINKMINLSLTHRVKNIHMMRFIVTSLLQIIVASAFAQSTSSSMQGHITDSNGEDLSGVNIVVLFQPTNTAFEATTNREGRFNLANLNPCGPYEITASFLGIRTENLHDVYLILRDALKFDIKLKEGTTSVTFFLI